MKPTAIVIEDEYKIREVFVNLLENFCPEIKVVAQAENISEAYDLIIEKKPSVIFLDIEMAGGNGFELLNKFDSIDFEIVFVTSYDHYALKAIKFCALDYLLKPVTIEELQDVVKRIINQIEGKHSIQQYKLLQENLKKPEQDATLIINSKTKLEYVLISDILYVEGDGNYSSIRLKNGNSHFVSKTLKEYEGMLCDQSEMFYRIHKSYIVNLSQIKHIEKGDNYNIILHNGTQLEVSRRKRQELMSKLNH